MEKKNKKEQNMERRKSVTALFALSAAVATATGATTDRPNVIVFLADDMGYADAGFTGATDIKTPNLDKLAASGVVFTQGYTNHPFSGPSRAALMSGRYQHRFGFETNPPHDAHNVNAGISTSEVLFPKRMQKAGYKTAAFGKWHLGSASVFHPCNRGFDYFYGFLGGGHDYFKIDLTQPVSHGYKDALLRNGQPATFEGYLTTALSRDAVAFVERNKDTPFFMYVAYNAPHQPLQAPKEDIERYSHIEDKKRRTYAAMVDVMDRGIGEVVESLKKSGLYENTLIFFMSDNGGPFGNASNNKPFRGQKGSMYEGGVHVPFMACWPAKIKGGVRYDYPVNAIDISRTAVDVSGGDATSAPAMEGTNLIPYVTGEIKTAPHDVIFWRGGDGNGKGAVTSDGYKFISRGKSPVELYNLRKDVGEQRSVAASSAAKVDEMKAAWNEWNKSNIPSAFYAIEKYDKAQKQFAEDALPERYKRYKESINKN